MIFRTIILLVLFLIASCTDLNPFLSGKNTSDVTIEDLALEIHQIAGDASADNIEQCRTHPIGAKPCGGPWAYLIYSAQNVDSDSLSALISRYDELDHIRNEEEGRISTCELISEPPLELDNGICRGSSSYAWSAGQLLRFNAIPEPQQ
jgi:hypothetical protein